MATPFLIVGEAFSRAPTTSVTVSAATWRGTSMSQRAFATLRTQTFQGRGNGRYSLLERGRPRVGAAKGTIDANFRMGTGADTVVLIQSTYSSTTTPLITLGVNASGQVVGSIQDIAGNTVAAWAATSHNTVAATGTIHVQLAWDATAPIDGSFHVWVTANGEVVLQSSYTTAPVNSWAPFQGLYITTGKFCGTGFDGEMLLTQASALAPVYVPRALRPVEIESSTLVIPPPIVQLSGSITPVVAFTSTFTLPSLQLTGIVTPAVSVAGSFALPSQQLSGALTLDTHKVSSWLRLAGATTTGQGYSSVPDLFASNPAVQTVDGRRPIASTSGNGYPLATFITSLATCLSWPVATNNNQDLTVKAGFAVWLRFATYSGIFKSVIDIGGSNGIYDNCKFEIYVDSSRRIHIYYFGIDTVSYLGRAAVSASNSAPIANTWFFLRTQFNGTLGTEALRCKTFVNEVEVTNTFSNVGSGGNPTQLRVTGAGVPIAIGNYQDGADSTYAVSATYGPNIYLLKEDLTAAQGAALMNFERPVFGPTEVSAVAGWLRFSQATITGSGYSSVPDALNGSNPATQSTDSARPAASTSNGFPIADFDGAGDILVWPAASNNNQTSRAGFGLWVRFDSVADGTKGIIGGLPGATNRFELIKDNSSLVVNVSYSQFIARRGTVASVFLANTWYFITWEYDGTQATDATKCVLTINGAVQTVTFTDDGGTPGAMPTTLVSTAGPFAIGARRASDALGPLDGKIGANIYSFGSKMTGATQGLLTSSARSLLQTYEPPQ